MTGVTNGAIHKDIGRLEGELTGLKDQLKHLQVHADQQSSDIAEIKEAITANKWRSFLTLGLVGGGGGATGGLLSKLLGN